MAKKKYRGLCIFLFIYVEAELLRQEVNGSAESPEWQ
jgi:hypothetical protein